jgi:hypothetical protein
VRKQKLHPEFEIAATIDDDGSDFSEATML